MHEARVQDAAGLYKICAHLASFCTYATIKVARSGLVLSGVDSHRIIAFSVDFNVYTTGEGEAKTVEIKPLAQALDKVKDTVYIKILADGIRVNQTHIPAYALDHMRIQSRPAVVLLELSSDYLLTCAREWNDEGVLMHAHRDGLTFHVGPRTWEAPPDSVISMTEESYAELGATFIKRIAKGARYSPIVRIQWDDQALVQFTYPIIGGTFRCFMRHNHVPPNPPVHAGVPRRASE